MYATNPVGGDACLFLVAATPRHPIACDILPSFPFCVLDCAGIWTYLGLVVSSPESAGLLPLVPDWYSMGGWDFTSNSGVARLSEAISFQTRCLTRSLHTTPDGHLSSASRSTVFGPACVSSGVRPLRVMTVTRFTSCVLSVAFFGIVGCATRTSNPLAGWKIDSDYQPSQAVVSDYRDYVKKLPEKERSCLSALEYFEDGQGQHAIRREQRVGDTSCYLVLIYNRENKRIKVMKYKAQWPNHQRIESTGARVGGS